MFGTEIIENLFEFFSTKVLLSLTGLLDGINHILLVTPNVTTIQPVQSLTGRAVWIVDTVFVITFVAAGVLAMASGTSERARYEVKDLLPRCVVGFIAAHFSQLIAGRLIELANAITTSLTVSNAERANAVDAIRSGVTDARPHTSVLLFIVCTVIIVVLVAATACSLIARFILAVVLTAVAPLALALHALPQTDGIARLWWRSYLGMLAVPVAQALVLYAGQWMLLDPNTSFSTLGLSNSGGPLNLLAIIVVLVATVKVPGLMRGLSSSAAKATSTAASVARIVVVQTITRGLPIPSPR